jgi:maltose/moltooligosaccharide transporter
MSSPDETPIATVEPAPGLEASLGGRGPKPLCVGTLVYTPRALVLVCFWLLWGDICVDVAKQVIVKLLPVSMRNLDASNATIGLLTSGLPAVLGMMLGPIVSSWSDRHRSRLGRRIPFLMLLAPAVVLALLLISQSRFLGEGLYACCGGWLGLVSPIAGMFAIMAISAVLFETTYGLVGSLYSYLVRDVIPAGLLGRFWGMARTVGAAGGFVFNRYCLGWAELHHALAFTAFAALYVVAFFLICTRVKEGEYPPPPIKSKRSGPTREVVTYFRECYSHPYYVLIYLGQAFYTCAASCVNIFIVLFGREDLGMSTDTVGKVLAWPFIVAIALYVPFGYVADRIHPLRLQIISLVFLPIVSLASFLGIQGESSFLVWTLAWWLGHCAYLASNGPLLPLLLPAAKYGQFYSAMYILAFMGGAAASLGGGFMLDLVGDYRYIYMWNFVFNILSLLVTLLIYRGWKRYGGAKSYQPPEEEPFENSCYTDRTAP